MQHGRRALHDAKNGNGGEEPEAEDEEHHDRAEEAGEAERVPERHVPEHDGQLLVGEREGPQSKVGGRVRDAVETEFYQGREKSVMVVKWRSRGNGNVPIV